MNADTFDLLQRTVDGRVTPEEFAVFEQLLASDQQLRAVYLDLVNLDTALHAAAVRANESVTIVQRTPSSISRSRSLTLAAVGAVLATVVLVTPSTHRVAARGSKIEALCAAVRHSPALTMAESPLFPAWMSPTATFLDVRDATQQGLPHDQ